MSELYELDKNNVVARLPLSIKTLIKARPKLMIGGGYIRSIIMKERPNDIDIFGPSKEYLHEAAQHFQLEIIKSTNIGKFKSENALTLKVKPYPVQFIDRWVFDNPDGLIESFDFTMAAAAIWYDETKKQWCSVCHNDYYRDLATRELVYTAPNRDEEPGGSLLRVRKFLKSGWNIRTNSLAGVLYRLYLGIDAKRANSASVDVEQIISGLLRDVDPLIPDDDNHPTTGGNNA